MSSMSPVSVGKELKHDNVVISSLPESARRRVDGNSDEPSKKKKPSRPNLWKIVRDAMGKDLTRLSLPVYFNEPLSFVQRVMEDIEYSDVLDRASQTGLQGTAERAALVATFMVSHFAATEGRTNKPFNPLLGETFDLVRHSPPVLALAEQVSHHPPVTALYARGEQWTYYTSYEVESRFHGNSLEVWPEGRVYIQFDDGELFHYEQAHTYVYNVLVGTSMSIDSVGEVELVDNGGRFRTWVKFKKGGRKHGGKVTGGVCDRADGTVLKTISGNWWDKVLVDDKVTWAVTKRPERKQTGGLFDLTSFAWTLNAPLSCSEKMTVPKTDSRLRPDVRSLELGDFKSAASEKDRLEKLQRQRRKGEESDKGSHTQAEPKWFKQVVSEDSDNGWRYNGGYFEIKQAASLNPHTGGWPSDDGPDIF